MENTTFPWNWKECMRKSFNSPKSCIKKPVQKPEEFFRSFGGINEKTEGKAKIFGTSETKMWGKGPTNLQGEKKL